MAKKPYALQILTVILLILLILTNASRVESQGSNYVENEAYHNQKGLEYYKEGFYQFTPKRQSEEANQSYELAIGEFKKVISINPSNADAHRNLARVYYVQKRFEEAAESYKKVTELNPDDLDSYVNTALAYTHIQKYDAALEQLEIAKTRTADTITIEKLNGYIQKVRQNR